MVVGDGQRSVFQARSNTFKRLVVVVSSSRFCKNNSTLDSGVPYTCFVTEAHTIVLSIYNISFTPSRRRLVNYRIILIYDDALVCMCVRACVRLKPRVRYNNRNHVETSFVRPNDGSHQNVFPCSNKRIYISDVIIISRSLIIVVFVYVYVGVCYKHIIFNLSG